MSLVSGAALEGGLTCSVPQMKESLNSRDLLEFSRAKRQQSWGRSRQMCLAWDHELCPLCSMENQFDVIKEQVGNNNSLSATLEAKSFSSIKTLLKASKML